MEETRKNSSKYYDYIKTIFDRKALQAPSEHCWMERDDCIWFRARTNFSGATPWGQQLVLVKGALYHSYQGVAPELLKLVEIIPSPFLMGVQKVAPLFEDLPDILTPREKEMLDAGCEAHVYGRTQGSLKSWADGTQKLLEVIEQIRGRVARENESQSKPQTSFLGRVFA